MCSRTLIKKNEENERELDGLGVWWGQRYTTGVWSNYYCWSLSVNNKAFACLAVDRSFDKFLLCDSSGLSEAIKKYVDYVRRPVSDNGIKEGPKCPKVDSMTFI